MHGNHAEPQAWESHPRAAFALKAVVLTAPIVLSAASSWAMSQVLPAPPDLWAMVVWWLVLSVTATAVLYGADRVARRLLPLSTLLTLSLVFPDQAPSRFRAAMRTSTVRQLERRVEQVRQVGLGPDPARAAQTVVELIGALGHHDRLTRGHSERVRAYTRMIAEEMSLPAEDVESLQWAALLHDVGKLARPCRHPQQGRATHRGGVPDRPDPRPSRRRARGAPRRLARATGSRRWVSTTRSGTGPATRWASPASRSPSPGGSWPWPTCSTSSPAPARTRTRCRPTPPASSSSAAPGRTSTTPSSVPSSTSRSAGCTWSWDRSPGWRSCPSSVGYRSGRCWGPRPVGWRPPWPWPSVACSPSPTTTPPPRRVSSWWPPPTRRSRRSPSRTPARRSPARRSPAHRRRHRRRRYQPPPRRPSPSPPPALPVDAAVTVQDDEATTVEDTPVTVEVTANDSPGLGVVLAAQPPIGSVSDEGGGLVRYEPPQDWAGSTAFEYQVTGDDRLRARVVVTVRPANDAPVAADDGLVVPEDAAPRLVDLVANDSDADGDRLMVTDVESSPALDAARRRRARSLRGGVRTPARHVRSGRRRLHGRRCHRCGDVGPTPHHRPGRERPPVVPARARTRSPPRTPAG